MKKKNKKHNSGFTLSETLIVLVVLVLLAGALATGLKAAGTSFNQISGKNDAQILCETLSQAILDEIHYSSDPKSDGSFTSTNYGSRVMFAADSDGKITLGGRQILGDGTYGDFKAAIDVSCDGTFFHVNITVNDRNGKKLSSSEFIARQIGTNVEPSTRIYIPEGATYPEWASGFRLAVQDSITRLGGPGGPGVVLNGQLLGYVLAGHNGQEYDDFSLYIISSNDINGKKIYRDNKMYMDNDILIDTGLTPEQVNTLKSISPVHVFFDTSFNYVGYSYRDKNGNANQKTILNYKDGTIIKLNFRSNIGANEEAYFIAHKDEALASQYRYE